MQLQHQAGIMTSRLNYVNLFNVKIYLAVYFISTFSDNNYDKSQSILLNIKNSSIFHKSNISSLNLKFQLC